MSFQLTKRVIKLLCGPFAYERGETYYRAGNVTITDYDQESSVYRATVKGNVSYRVLIEIDVNGDVDAKCVCPASESSPKYCKHIAAALLNIHDVQNSGKTPVRAYPSLLDGNSGLLTPRSYATLPIRASTGISSPSDEGITNEMLELFVAKPSRPGSGRRQLFDNRETLDVELTISPFPYGYRKYMFGVELKVGSKRLYIVQKIREFLDRVNRGESYVFSKHFTYDPRLHSFSQDNDAVIRQLVEIYRNEKLYRETSSIYSAHANHLSGDRMLLVPPASWNAIYPLLADAPNIQLDHDGQNYVGIRISDESIPLTFDFDRVLPEEGQGYRLAVQGLDRITVMEPYGIILAGGKLLKRKTDQCKRLSDLKQMFEASNRNQVIIAPTQMEPFMEQVIPGLMKLGSVHIAEAVSQRIERHPLKAKLYLDRLRDRLLAGLEFQYGDIIFNPLEGTNKSRGSDRILMRDVDQEARILELMEQSDFAKTESGYFMDDEEEQYDFLYHIIPQLEKLLQVYATTAVKSRLFVPNAPPKVQIDVDERTDWLEIKFEFEGIPENAIRHILKSLDEKRRYYKLPNGALLPLENTDYEEINRLMNEIGVPKDALTGSEFRVPIVRGLHVMDADRHGQAVKFGKSFRKLLDNMRNPDNLDFSVPDSLSSVLRDYQKFGYQWLKTLAHYRFGGILADDMGLGKTLQSIAYLVSVLPEIRAQKVPAIIVCPASLMYNWRNELKKFAPEVRAVIADGSKSERELILSRLSETDVLITSYPLLRRDVESYANPSFHTLFLDEAQAFKNHATQTAHAVKSIQARYRFALTGTPIENAIEELWSIYDAVFPELFQDRRSFNELTRETVAKRIRPFLLRRLKKDVLKELPDKIESLQASELLPEQKKLYLAYLAQLQKETLKHLNEDGFNKHRIKILAGLTRLRQLCCHPALFVEGYEGSSAKFEQLLEIIEECRSAGKRLLVFSQFTEMLGIIGRELGYQGIPFFYLDGSTPSSERVELCDKFNDGERDLFLISLKAGGTGLNLTGADTVILYDLWWNPAVEQQAADRAHRMGQKNVVQVLRLITQGTVEDKMYALQQRKKNLIDEVIQPGQEALSTMTEQEVREILMLG